MFSVGRIICFCCLFLSWTSTALSDFSGSVVSIVDGDTIEVLHNRHAERIRLNGIDCPEKGQVYGHKAKQAVADLVFGKEVTLQIYGLDKYGRTIADVLLVDGTNVNHRLVKDGWCWWYRKYAQENVALEKLEKDARDTKKGLWIDPAPVPPWVFRKAKRGQALDFSDMVPLDSHTRDEALPRGPPGLGIADLDPAPSSSPYPIVTITRSASMPAPGRSNRKSRSGASDAVKEPLSVLP